MFHVLSQISGRPFLAALDELIQQIEGLTIVPAAIADLTAYRNAINRNHIHMSEKSIYVKKRKIQTNKINDFETVCELVNP